MNSEITKGSRLHKLSPVFILLHVIWQAIFPLVFGIYTYSYRGDGSTENIMIAAGIIIPAFSILQYWFYHYWIKQDKIEIREGIIFKKSRKIPYTRIQNVNVSQNLLQRLLNVATLQLESASGGKPEAVMRVVGLDVVEHIKQKVRVVHSQSEADIQGESEGAKVQSVEQEETSILHQMTLADVIKFGFISQKGIIYGAIVFGFLAQNQQFMANAVKYIGWFYTMPDLTRITFAQGLVYISVIGLVLFVFLQMMSVLWALLKFYRFEIGRHESRLHASMGLLSKISATVPLKKIQLYRINENPLHKFFKARTLTIETAGGVNTDKSGIVMRWLAPYIHKDKVTEFVSHIEPKIKVGSVSWQQLPYRSWKRVFKRKIIILTLIGLLFLLLTYIPYLSIRNYIWFVFPLMIPVAYIYSKKYIRKTGFYYDEDVICFKSGVWFGKQSFVKVNKIQTLRLQQSPFDRMNNMATLEIDTAGSNILLHHVKIPYLENKDAYEIRNFLLNEIKRREFDW